MDAFSRRLSIELVFANHALSPIDHRFDMVLQDAAGFGERFHDLISAACARICVAIGCESDVLPDGIFVLHHCLRDKVNGVALSNAVSEAIAP
jgi:hypothetical protein